VKVSYDFGGNGHAPNMGGHHPLYAEVARAVGKPGVLRGVNLAGNRVPTGNQLYQSGYWL
jgi:hypothetical protein